MMKKLPKSETRTEEEIRQHYEIEKELASRLREAGKSERCQMYTTVYDELYSRVPKHPQLTRQNNENAQKKYSRAQLRNLKPFLKKDGIFIEIGAGDCSLSKAVTPFVQEVHAVDVSSKIMQTFKDIPNFHIFISEGTNLPVLKNKIYIVYCNQLLEHLHPEDVKEQLRNIFAALTENGMYYCITPNRLSGPHDISKYFDDNATGFHLKEYTTGELVELLKVTGFSKIRRILGRGVYQILLPTLPFVVFEVVLSCMPKVITKTLCKTKLLRFLLGIKIIAYK